MNPYWSACSSSVACRPNRSSQIRRFVSTWLFFIRRRQAQPSQTQYRCKSSASLSLSLSLPALDAPPALCYSRINYRRGTARRASSLEILSIAAQLCENSQLKMLAVGEWSWRSLKVIGTSAIRQAIYHFLSRCSFMGGQNRRITNPRWRTAAILKNRKKQQYLRNGLTDLHEIWLIDAHGTSEGRGQLKIQTFENPRWRRPLF